MTTVRSNRPKIAISNDKNVKCDDDDNDDGDGGDYDDDNDNNDADRTPQQSIWIGPGPGTILQNLNAKIIRFLSVHVVTIASCAGDVDTDRAYLETFYKQLKLQNR